MTSHGGRQIVTTRSASISNFQLTTSHGGRLVLIGTHGVLHSFNSRPHMEVDGSTDCRPHEAGSFNSRPHMEVDDSLSLNCFSLMHFQLTTSHGGRLLRAGEQICDIALSTHDLTWRSTLCGVLLCISVVLSTHDLTWRSTCTTRCSEVGTRTFNSRPHMEVDVGLF